MRVILGKAMALAGVAGLALGAPAAAQDLRDLDSEAGDVRVFTGELTVGPARFSYTLEPGRAVVIDVVPAPGSPLDPTLAVSDAVTGEVLAEDDDGGGGVAARARIHAPEGRRLAIEVGSFAFAEGEASAGAFELRLSASDFVPTPSRAVTHGARLEGVLQPGEEHLFTLQGEQGTLLEVALLAADDDLDPTLTLYPGEGTLGEPLGTDDDSGGDLNALLRLVLPDSGSYTIAAGGVQGTGGRYALRVAPAREPLVQAPEQAIALGDRLGGRLGQGYENGGVDPAAITYRLTPEAVAAVRAGSGRVTFNMSALATGDDDIFASAIDSYLELGFETPLGFAPVLTDDDGGAGLDARIALDMAPLRDGEWLERLRLRASNLGTGGDYTIELVEGMQAVEEDEFQELAPGDFAPEGPVPIEGRDGIGGEGDLDPADPLDPADMLDPDDDELVPTEVRPAPPIRATD